ncbi:hypothetical protein [Nocardia huaxiensis]|uniref:Uncharacterized protein n=1 Tax=Nocardia huaxiensis TaxID=2755382 RepID=A0A7D6ZF37_9NOCA|nr:hypothetical protein [Nocardia huaxiensis]QLY33988.1 hypothetical protein H0264_18690 [Nocardia huaxiensis]UFS99109.1 hypothetical protein LPY97_15020 [Nocardia huaxiensis]
MTPQDRQPDLAALRAEEHRMRVVDEVIDDMLTAAIESMERKDFCDCGSERAKQRHWDEIHESVWTDYDAAKDAVNEAVFGRAFVEKLQAQRAAQLAARPQMPRGGIERSR